MNTEPEKWDHRGSPNEEHLAHFRYLNTCFKNCLLNEIFTS